MIYSLLTFPVEIYHQILEHICPHCIDSRDPHESFKPRRAYMNHENRLRSPFDNYEALRGVYNASRVLRARTVPIMAHCVTVTRQPFSLLEVTRLVCQQPEIACSVRELSFLPNWHLHAAPVGLNSLDFSFIPAELQHDVQRITSCRSVRKKIHPNPVSAAERALKMLMPLLLQTLFLKTKNLRHMDIRWENNCYTDILPGPTSLPMLKSLYWRCDGAHHTPRPPPDRTHLPHLDYLRLMNCSHGRPSLRMRDVKILHLDDCFFSTAKLKACLRACPNLQSLRITHNYRERFGIDYLTYTSQDLVDALFAVKSTLRHLDIYLEEPYIWNPELFFDDLIMLEKLELLCTNQEFMVSNTSSTNRHMELIRLFPKSIRTVSLGRVSQNFFPSINKFAHAVAQGEYPNLAYFEYQAFPQDEALQQDEALFKDMLRKSGVECRQGASQGWSKDEHNIDQSGLY